MFLGELLIKPLAKKSRLTTLENKGGKELQNLSNIIMKFLEVFNKIWGQDKKDTDFSYFPVVMETQRHQGSFKARWFH